jgi:membrane fusion protein, multidrug efflux system
MAATQPTSGEAARPALEPVEAGGARPSGEAPAPQKKPSKRRSIVLAVGLIAALGAGGYYLHSRQYEDTDDAQVDADISNVSPRVAGTLTAVYVEDNQRVKTGDLLAKIDPADYEVALTQAQAELAQAEAAVRAENPSVSITETSNQTALSSAQADLASAGSGRLAAEREVKQLTAALAQAKANALTANQNKARDKRLVESGSISQAQFDTVSNSADAANAQVDSVSASLAAAKARVAQAVSRITAARATLNDVQQNAPLQVDVRKASVNGREAALALAKARLDQAQLNLKYTKIVAPVSGVIGRKAMSVGDHVAPGQDIVAIVQVGRLWITANFRETQLRRMHPGQPATVHVDATDQDFRGSVESVGAATGARFSLFPPENASGNFVKIVQRIPVRIRLDPNQPGLDRLRPGMSVEPEVKVR